MIKFIAPCSFFHFYKVFQLLVSEILTEEDQQVIKKEALGKILEN